MDRETMKEIMDEFKGMRHWPGCTRARGAGGLEPVDCDHVEVYRFKPCNDPEHWPPTHLYIPAGYRYRHVCPKCGTERLIESNGVTTGVSGG